VTALLGERNRKVRAVIRARSGPEGMEALGWSLVANLGPPRSACESGPCFVALAVASVFRDQGKNVLLSDGTR